MAIDQDPVFVLLRDACLEVEKQHPVCLSANRLVAYRAYEVWRMCNACRAKRQICDLTEVAIENLDAQMLFAVIAGAVRDYGCNCQDDKIDGLTPYDCLLTFRDRQWFADYGDVHLAPMTPRQLECAHSEWSRQLREKVEASKEKERCQVLVDLQDEP